MATTTHYGLLRSSCSLGHTQIACKGDFIALPLTKAIVGVWLVEELSSKVGLWAISNDITRGNHGKPPPQSTTRHLYAVRYFKPLNQRERWEDASSSKLSKLRCNKFWHKQISMGFGPLATAAWGR